MYKINVIYLPCYSGKKYFTYKRKIVCEKKFCNSPRLCKLKCGEKITEEQRNSLFNAFYKMGNIQTQNGYITGFCRQTVPKMHHPRDDRRGTKGISVKCYFQLADDNINVCKKYFF